LKNFANDIIDADTLRMEKQKRIDEDVMTEEMNAPTVTPGFLGELSFRESNHVETEMSQKKGFAGET